MLGSFFVILILVMSSGVQAHEAVDCASTLGEFRRLSGDASFPSRWTEVSMDDSKPLVVSIVERNGSLSIEFVKTGEGPWAEVSGAICNTGIDFQLRMTKEQIHLGAAAPWMLRLALADGGIFTLRLHEPNQLLIKTEGWLGRFVPATID